jgi:hypothetical protein
MESKLVETAWVLSNDVTDVYERMVQIKCGYDHRHLKDRGWHGDELYLIVRRPEQRGVDGSALQEAAVLRLFTSRLHGRFEPTLATVYKRIVHPMGLSLHCSVLGDAVGSECSYMQSGRCVDAFDTALGSDELWTNVPTDRLTTEILVDDARLMQRLLDTELLWSKLMAWRDDRAASWRRRSIDHRCAHCYEGGLVARPFPALFVEGKTEPCIPRERWGKEHERLLLYIETVCVDAQGKPDGRRMSHNPDRTPPHGNPCDWDDKYSTRLKDGTQVKGHDDWACVEDFIAAGLLKWEGTGTHPVFVLTDLGWNVAWRLRRQRAEPRG